MCIAITETLNSFCKVPPNTSISSQEKFNTSKLLKVPPSLLVSMKAAGSLLKFGAYRVSEAMDKVFMCLGLMVLDGQRYYRNLQDI